MPKNVDFKGFFEGRLISCRGKQKALLSLLHNLAFLSFSWYFGLCNTSCGYNSSQVGFTSDSLFFLNISNRPIFQSPLSVKPCSVLLLQRSVPPCESSPPWHLLSRGGCRYSWSHRCRNDPFTLSDRINGFSIRSSFFINSFSASGYSSTITTVYWYR